jgi:trimeric autotransporter adhesin
MFSFATFRNETRLKKLVLSFLALSVIGLSVAGWRVSARRAESKAAGGESGLAGVLNPDGTLKPGVQGSFDPAGFRMIYGPKGEPRFVPAGSAAAMAGCTDGWDNRFFADGVDGVVDALLVNGTDLYVGGTFKVAGNALANRVAKWDGANWSGVGNGLSGRVLALLLSGDTLYASGQFTGICTNMLCSTTTQANSVAQYSLSGGSWSVVGNGLSGGDVRALAMIGSTLYAGGAFTGICTTLACGATTTANRVAQFSGGSWSAAGTGFPTDVYALAVIGTTLYAGGGFNRICNDLTCAAPVTVANRVAQFNAGSWTAVGNGLNSAVNALAVSGTTLYAGGSFTGICTTLACGATTQANRVAQFSGGSWSVTGNGFDNAVLSLFVSGTTIYAGGDFTGICTTLACGATTPANHVAQFSGGVWSALSNGLDNTVNAVAVIGSTVYAGGFIGGICTNATCTTKTLANRITQFNAGSWTTMGTNNTVNNSIRALAVNGSDVYVGGDMIQADGVAVNRVAKWDGTNWSAAGNGVNGQIFALLFSGSTLYAAGSFTGICTDAACSGTTPANRVAQFSGGVWSAVGNGVNNTVYALALSGTTLYAGGELTGTCNNAACGATTMANLVAQFSGGSWSAVGNGLDSTGGTRVNALAVAGSTLYAGGTFMGICTTLACGATTIANRVAQFSGGSWSPVGTGNGFNGQVNALAVSATTLYAGGFFTGICNNAACAAPTAANYIAQIPLAGGSWTMVGNGLDFLVSALLYSGTTLYAGGAFQAICNDAGCVGKTTANRVAQFSGGSWTTFGDGLNGQALAIALAGSDFYAGGQFFSTAGCHPSVNFAHFNGTFAPTVAKSFVATQIPLNGTTTMSFQVSNPNAATTLNNISFSDNFPAGLVVDTPVMTTNNCGGNFNPALAGGATSFTYQNGSLAGNASCTITIKVKGTIVGNKSNTTGAVSSTESGAGGTSNTAMLAVVTPPTIAKSFAAPNIPLNGTTTLTLTITNPAANTVGLTGIAVTDNFPAGLEVDAAPMASNTCGGTFTANAGATTISLVNGAIATPGNSCTLSVKVKGTTAGAKSNTTGTITSTEGGTGATSNTASLNVFTPPTISKAFSPTTVPVNGVTTLTLTITNPAANPGGLTGIAVTDNFPAGLEVDAAPMASNTCGGTFTASAGATMISLANGAIATPGNSCTLSVKVKNTTATAKNNTTGNVSSTEGGAGGTSNTATLNTNSPPTIVTLNVMRVAGSPATNTPIANVSDAEQAANTLSVTVNGGANATVNGVTVSNLSITAGGVVNADVAATAVAATASFTLRVTDSGGLFAEATLTVTVVRYSGSLADPLACTGPGSTVAVTLVLGNTGATPLMVSNTTTFTNLVGVPGSCTVTPNVGTCTLTNTTLTYTATLAANQTVTLNYLAQVADGTPSGAQICSNNSATFGGGAPVSLQICNTLTCPTAGPGLSLPATAEVSDQRAGSVLVYNLYSSSIAAPNAQNTRVSITNTHPTLPVAVHLFFVDGVTCSIADSLICLTAQQTASFLASDIDPGTTGYIVAVASDRVTGCPINFNYLIGDAYVKLSSGHAANLAAEGFGALAGGLPACDAASVTTILNFDGVSYNRAPRVLAASNIPSRADGNDTLLVLNRIGGSLVTGAATLSNLFGIIYDDAENPLSFTFNPGTCQFRSSLSNNFPRVAPRFDQFIPAGRSGWGKFYATGELGLLGAQINYNPNAGTASNAFNQGHNLHKLTLTQSVQLTIPIFPPNC